MEKIMIKATFLDNLSSKIIALIKNSPAQDVEKSIHALLQGAFTKLDLVSREEYAVQVDLLRVSREKLDALEIKLAELEILLQKSNK